MALVVTTRLEYITVVAPGSSMLRHNIHTVDTHTRLTVNSILKIFLKKEDS